MFGASKVAADVLTQEYGRYFGLRTGTFRGGCLTGPHHSGVELHGFLSYLVHTALREGPYTIFGYKGKQVRDQIHSADVISAFWAFAQDPRPGEAYNLGGGKANAASLLECVELVAEASGRQAPRAHLRRAGPGRRPHLLLLRHGQVPGALPRLAPGARPCRPSSRRWWPRSRRSSTDGTPRVRLTLVNQFYAPDISPTAQLAASLAEHRAEQGDQVTIVTGRAGYLEGAGPRGRACAPGPSCGSGGCGRPTSASRRAIRRLLGYVDLLRSAASAAAGRSPART